MLIYKNIVHKRKRIVTFQAKNISKGKSNSTTALKSSFIMNNITKFSDLNTILKCIYW